MAKKTLTKQQVSGEEITKNFRYIKAIKWGTSGCKWTKTNTKRGWKRCLSTIEKDPPICIVTVTFHDNSKQKHKLWNRECVVKDGDEITFPR